MYKDALTYIGRWFTSFLLFSIVSCVTSSQVYGAEVNLVAWYQNNGKVAVGVTSSGTDARYTLAFGRNELGVKLSWKRDIELSADTLQLISAGADSLVEKADTAYLYQGDKLVATSPIQQLKNGWDYYESTAYILKPGMDLACSFNIEYFVESKEKGTEVLIGLPESIKITNNTNQIKLNSEVTQPVVKILAADRKLPNESSLSQRITRAKTQSIYVEPGRISFTGTVPDVQNVGLVNLSFYRAYTTKIGFGEGDKSGPIYLVVPNFYITKSVNF